MHNKTSRNKSLALKGVNRYYNSEIRKSNVVSSKGNDTLSFTMISSNNDGKRYNWWEDEYFIERLDIKGANYERLNTFFKDHTHTTDGAIGKVENVRVENGELIGDVAFSQDPASKAIEDKYRADILTDVSIAYEIVDYSVEKREGELDLVTVTNFNIFELSAVGIGFDSGAKKREKEMEMDKELIARLKELVDKAERTAEETKEMEKLKSMEKREKEITEAKITKEKGLADEKIRALELKVAENDRKEEVRSICEEFNASEETLRTFMKEGTPEELKTAILKERSAKEQPVRVYVDANGGQRESMLKDMKDGFAMRMGAKIEDASREAQQFKMASLLDMGRALTGYAGYDRQVLAKRTLVTADFPLLLESAGNRVLTQNFAEADGTYRQWVAGEDVADFRPQTDITYVNGGELPKIVQAGDLVESEKGNENGETWQLGSYGKKFTLTRQMLINDDLKALNTLFSEFGIIADRTLNRHCYSLLQGTDEYSGYKMADGSAIFVAGHSNTQSLALDSTNLGLAKKLMRKQKDAAKKSLNLAPSYLLVGADLEQTALQILNSTADLADNKNAGVVNTHYKTVAPIIENAIASDGWYLATNRRTIKVGYLQGTNRSPITNIIDTSLVGVTIEGIFDFAVMAEDYRGMVKGK